MGTIRRQPCLLVAKICLYSFQLGGVVMPNDGKCHMSKGDYIASSTMDYPSLSFLREQMLEAEIVPIFATTGNLELFMVSYC